MQSFIASVTHTYTQSALWHCLKLYIWHRSIDVIYAMTTVSSDPRMRRKHWYIIYICIYIYTHI